ncbi:MAG: hypothetical protein MJ138_01150 [Kiritimatiellae bacterium]|nr:hypothetical protein [Kiritimatiellia bacterium]
MKKALAISALVALAAGGWWFQSHDENALARADDAQTNFLVAGLGGFRGILAEFTWFRADRLQDEGRYTELAQLANVLTSLEPHTPEVWSYAAWNLAYNISVMMPTASDRWRWVLSGLKLLRDDGIRLNPASPELHCELSNLFLFKIGGTADEAAPLYREEWKKIVREARAKNDWASLKMDASLMDYLDAEYGRQDWEDPKAHALYWAHLGMTFKPKGGPRLDLRQMIYETLMLESLEDARFAPRALRAMKEAALEMERPNRTLIDLIERYRAKFNLK